MNAITKTESTISFLYGCCLGCGYCAWACPFGAPQLLGGLPFTLNGKMDKCTFCVLPFEGGEQREPNARCVAFCATKALLAGDSSEINETYRKRAAARLQPGTIV